MTNDLFTVLQHQLDELWNTRLLSGVDIDWELVADTSATARGAEMTELADILLAAYDERSARLLRDATQPLPYRFLADPEPTWVAAARGTEVNARRLIHVETGFRFEWWAYIDNDDKPRHMVFATTTHTLDWPGVADIAALFDNTTSSREGRGVVGIGGKNIGSIRVNVHIDRCITEIAPRTIDLWYDTESWQKLHDMFVNAWKERRYGR